MNKIKEIKSIDLLEQFESAKEIFKSFLANYKTQNSWKIRLIDTYVVFCSIIFLVTLLYVFLNGLFPMNAILASLICSLGSIILAGKMSFIIIYVFFKFLHQFMIYQYIKIN